MSIPTIAFFQKGEAPKGVVGFRALDQLDSLSRAAFVLRHVEGYELEETARLCGCSLATIKRRLARAEKRFQALSRGDAVLRDLLSEELG